MIQEVDTRRILDALRSIHDAVERVRERIVAADAGLVATAEKVETSATRSLTIADRIAAYAAPTPESIKRGDYASTRLVAARARVSAEITEQRQQANVAYAHSPWAATHLAGREFVAGNVLSTSKAPFPSRRPAGEAAP